MTEEINTPDLVQANSSSAPAAKPVPQRDAKGRLMKGHSGNPGGLSKIAKEVKEMAAHIVVNDGWDRLHERLNDPKTPAVVVVQIVEMLYGIAFGKPGLRKEDQGITLEDMQKLIPPIIFSNTEKLKELGIDLQVNKSGEQADEDPV